MIPPGKSRGAKRPGGHGAWRFARNASGRKALPRGGRFRRAGTVGPGPPQLSRNLRNAATQSGQRCPTLASLMISSTRSSGMGSR